MFVQNQEKVNYDNEHDILYIFLGPPRYGYEDEIFPGVFLRKDDDTDEVIGAIIMGYRNINLSKLGKMIPFKIDFEKINKSFLH